MSNVPLPPLELVDPLAPLVPLDPPPLDDDEPPDDDDDDDEPDAPLLDPSTPVTDPPQATRPAIIGKRTEKRA
jgi:hypothetical protein